MLTDFLISVAERAPMLLLALVGIIVALVSWKRHPAVSGLTAIAFVIYLIKSFTFTALYYYWLPNLRESMQLSLNAISTLSNVFGLFNDIFFAIVLLMLVIAALSKRDLSEVA